jgi:hypothetical protein
MNRPRAENVEADVGGVNATGFFPVLITDRLTDCRDFYVRHSGFKMVND